MHVPNLPRSSLTHALAVAVALIFSARLVAAAEIIFVTDFENSHPIQWIQHHSAQFQSLGLSISSGAAVVTAGRNCNMMGKALLYLQVPPALNQNSDYPDYSAIKVFVNCSIIVPSVGDCISVDGVITDFNGATELTSATYTQLPSAVCGTLPTAYTGASVADVASDGDPLTAGNQPGPRTEALESVLLTLSSLEAITPNDGSGDFLVTAQNNLTGPRVVVGSNLYLYTATPATLFNSITGVLDQQDAAGQTVFKLLPRSASDVQ